MSTASRVITSLDGTWDLQVLGTDRTPLDHAKVAVPSPWTTQVPGYEDSHDTVIYTRTFEVAHATDKRAILRFGAVNYTAQVAVNGVHVGTHAGSWTSFEFDVTDRLIEGTNMLEVEVSYPPRYGSDNEPGFLEVPHGKQSWYGTTAGIWQSVTLEQRSALHITDLSVRSDAKSGTVVVKPVLSLSDESAEVRVDVTFDGGLVGSATGAAGETISVAVESELQLWGVDDPNLYEVTVTAVHNGNAVDSVTRTTGFRTFETHDGKFFLNGHEIEVRAVLDQDYHPNSSSVPESTEALEDLFRKTRALGFNMLRVHIKRPDPRYYELADKLGILVWTELPSWLTWTPEVAHEGLELLKQFIAEDQHHPSIVTWTIINESWGMDIRSAKQRAWLRNAFDEIKDVAQGSLVVDNSACLPNFHLKTDIDDYHLYRGIPESRREWDSKIAEFAGRADWTFSPYGDAERTGQEPLMLSEFGNWGLPYSLDQYTDGQEPWWFAIGADWAFGAAEGTDLIGRFERTGLADVFGTWDNLVTAVQRVQLIANRYQTTCIRSHPSISGYVVTQLSDVEWEANGLFDANRTPKRFNDQFALANGDYAVALRPGAYSLHAGQQLTVDVTVVPARTGKPAGLIQNAQVKFLVDGAVVSALSTSVDNWNTSVHTLEMPKVVSQYEVAAELWVDGTLVARDAADVLVVPPADALPQTPNAPIYASDQGIQEWLTALGFENSIADSSFDLDDQEVTGLYVTTRLDARAQSFARNGGKVLTLAETSDAFDDALDFLPSARLGLRSGDGDWVPRNEWLARKDAFAQVPGDTILGIAFEDLLGDYVVNGVPNMMRPAIKYSGIFSGWLRGQATSTAKFRWSEGQITVTTFKLRAGLETSPVAHTLGRAMVLAAGSSS